MIYYSIFHGKLRRRREVDVLSSQVQHTNTSVNQNFVKVCFFSEKVVIKLQIMFFPLINSHITEHVHDAALFFDTFSVFELSVDLYCFIMR